jgi:hypothetical protein
VTGHADTEFNGILDVVSTVKLPPRQGGVDTDSRQHHGGAAQDHAGDEVQRRAAGVYTPPLFGST